MNRSPVLRVNGGHGGGVGEFVALGIKAPVNGC